MNFHLVLEQKPGDFMPIDINILLNNDINYLNLLNIDSFTKKYLENEILIMIRDNNIVPSSYLNGKLQIINDKKFRYPVIYKDTNFTIDTFFESYIDDKQMMNKFLNIYLKYNDNKDLIQKYIDKKDIESILNVLYNLDYVTLRKIYFYLLSL